MIWILQQLALSLSLSALCVLSTRLYSSVRSLLTKGSLSLRHLFTYLFFFCFLASFCCYFLAVSILLQSPCTHEGVLVYKFRRGECWNVIIIHLQLWCLFPTCSLMRLYQMTLMTFLLAICKSSCLTPYLQKPSNITLLKLCPSDGHKVLDISSYVLESFFLVFSCCLYP